MLKIARKSFTSRELENGFKFIMVDDVFMKITKAVRTVNDYTFTVGEKNITLNAFEIDIYSVWSVNKNINIIPLFGFYKPKHDLSDGGNQMPNNKLNTYSQLLLQYTY